MRHYDPMFVRLPTKSPYNRKQQKHHRFINDAKRPYLATVNPCKKRYHS